MRNIFMIICCCSLLPVIIQAQALTIKGKIVDPDGKPVSNASVAVKGTTRGTVADANGNFMILAAANDTLSISSSSYTSHDLAIEGRTQLFITLSANAAELQQVVFVGTRRAGRAKTETPVPVDVISLSSPQPTGRMDLTSILNYAAPSFNYNKQSGSDGADHVELATLRGLGPDQTLVLINGKRRYQTAFVSVFGTRGRGNSGTDLNAIPVSAIDRVEILRDGASAQYGSDAIAGVINIILKKSLNKLTGNIGASGYYDQRYNTAFKKSLDQYNYDSKLDGKLFTAGLNYGIPLGKKGGVINLSADYLNNGKTFRQVLDTSNPVTNKKALPINAYRRSNGEGSVEMGSGMFNLEIPLAGSGSRFYSFGSYSKRATDAYAFTRDFSANPERFPTDANGNAIPHPGIIKNTPDGVVYFDPHIQTDIKDASLSAGVTGTGKNGGNWDLSNTIGYNRFHFFGDQTFNASLGATKTHFDDGGFTFLQNTTNLNFSKEIAGIAEGFNLAYGAEFRMERYTMFAGEQDSYKNYSNGNKASGSQGFPGYQPSDEVKANRNNQAVYADAEIDITRNLLVSGALRLEHYSDFGFTLNYKLSSRVKVSDDFNIRGSFSSGFRAPSLQQINFSSTFTTVQGSNFAEVKIAPNYSPITRAAGIPELKREKSLNGSLGFTYNLASALNLTVDGYWVKIRDRVVLSGQFAADDPDIDPALAAEMARLKVGLAQFFANAVNTVNKGIDVVLDFNERMNDSRVRVLLAANVQNMKIKKINVPDRLSGSESLKQTFLSDREQAFILASAPHHKLALNAEYGYKKVAVGTRVTYFGKVRILGYGDDYLGINPKVPSDLDPNLRVPDEYHYSGKFVTDLYASIGFTKQLTLMMGVDNLFNVHPRLGVADGARLFAYNNEPAGPFDAVQMGADGRRLFAKLMINF